MTPAPAGPDTSEQTTGREQPVPVPGTNTALWPVSRSGKSRGVWVHGRPRFRLETVRSHPLDGNSNRVCK